MGVARVAPRDVRSRAAALLTTMSVEAEPRSIRSAVSGHVRAAAEGASRRHRKPTRSESDGTCQRYQLTGRLRYLRDSRSEPVREGRGVYVGASGRR